MNWRRQLDRGRKNAIRSIAAAAILLGAVPAWPQNEAAQSPDPGNTLSSSPFAQFMARFSRPQIAQAAPRATRPQVPRARVSRPKQPAALPQAAAPAEEPPTSRPSWPIAQESVGAAGLVPVEIRTVREMVGSETETSLVLENELSDLDISARPISRLDEPISSTDGRASAEEQRSGNRIAAFAENLKAIGAAAWLEPILLVLAGAIAAVSAMRVFAA